MAQICSFIPEEDKIFYKFISMAAGDEIIYRFSLARHISIQCMLS